MTIEERIEVVNEIIKEISSRGRRFFYDNESGDIAHVFIKNIKLYMKNEWNKEEICLSQREDRKPRSFHHGGTLWGLTLDFKDFIQTGEKSNHNHGYGGLYCPHWGYPEKDMKAIQKKAKELNYL